MKKKNIYSKPPILEASFVVKWRLKIDTEQHNNFIKSEEFLKNIKDIFATNFPEINSSDILNQPIRHGFIGVSNDGVGVAPLKVQGYQFYIGNVISIQYLAEQFVFIVRRDYRGFSFYKKTIENLIAIDKENISYTTYISSHFINKINIFDNEDIITYFKLSPVLISDYTTKNLFLRSVIDGDQIDGNKAFIILADTEPDEIGKRSIILDIECQRSEKNILENFTDIVKKIEEVNDVESEIFESIITKEAKKLFN